MTATLTNLQILTLDCQATGANPDKGNLLEIGWLPTRASAADNSVRIGLQAYLVCLPADAIIPRAVERITGISDESTATGLSSGSVWGRLVDTAQKITGGNPSAACPLVIHFASNRPEI